MTSLARFVLAVLLPAASAQAAVQPTLQERFAPRHYLSGGERVPVDAALNALTVRADARLESSAVQQIVEAAAAKLQTPVKITSTRQLRRHGLYLVELAESLPRAQLVRLAAAVARDADIESVQPVLTRMTGRAFADDHLVVTAAPGRLADVLTRVLRATDGTLLRHSRVADTALIAVGAAMARDSVEASRLLVDVPFLLSAEPELYREYELLATVDDPLHAQQWHLHRPAPNQPVPGVGQIFAHAAWDVTKGNANVIIAVFDSGMDVDHEDLAANVVGMFDPSDDDEDARPGCTASSDGRGEAATCTELQPYRESHGTAVGGVIAAVGDNGIGLTGVCPNCKLVAVRLLGDQVGSGLSTAESFTRAVDDGAWIINNSWGPGRSRYFPMSMAERIAFDHARTTGRGGLGTVIVFAAGNSTANVASDPYASHPFAIAVAASSNLDDWVAYSNYGREIDIAAPTLGGTVQQDNYGLWTTDVSTDEGYSEGKYADSFSGTSASSPVVAGVAGLVLSVNANLTAEQVRLVLTRTADKIRADKINWADIFNQDLNVTFAYDENGHSIGFGYGRVNAERAVALAAAPGLFGAVCTAPGCLGCGADNRCMVACTTQADCVDGTVCTTGACMSPTVLPTDLGAPCSSACEHCTSTIDTEGYEQSICTQACSADADCPTGWDCRLIDTEGNGLCAVGNVNAGLRNAGFNCRSDLFQSSLLVSNGAGEAFCTDICFGDEPGACPYGFHCSGARCSCSAMTTFGCSTYSCSEDDNNATWETPLCFPDPDFGLNCVDNSGCPAGDYCNTSGNCVPDDRAGCTVCQECERDADCGAGNICYFSRNAAPVCTRGCYNDDYCPGDSVCRMVMRRGTVIQLCLSPSTSTTLCETDFECTVACREDVLCADGKVCEEGACVDAPPPPDAGVPEEVDAGGTVQQPVDVNPPDDNRSPAFGCSATGNHPLAGAAWGLGLMVAAVLRTRRRH